MTNLIQKIQSIQSQSNASWETAVDTAGPDYAGGSEANQDAMQSLADSADISYDNAIAALEMADLDASNYWRAIEELKSARSAESEGGDCSFADEAIELIEQTIESLDIVTVE